MQSVAGFVLWVIGISWSTVRNGEERKASVSCAKFKRVAKSSVIKINNTLMKYFKNPNQQTKAILFVNQVLPEWRVWVGEWHAERFPFGKVYQVVESSSGKTGLRPGPASASVEGKTVGAGTASGPGDVLHLAPSLSCCFFSPIFLVSTFCCCPQRC